MGEMMKYLGHDTNSRNDVRLKRLIKKHGVKGYGVYWAINEIIAEKIDRSNLSCRLECSIEELADEFNEDTDTIRTIAGYCTDMGLITFDGKNYLNTKILKRLDEYTKKSIRTLSGEYPTKERKEKNEINEKKETDQTPQTQAIKKWPSTSTAKPVKTYMDKMNEQWAKEDKTITSKDIPKAKELIKPIEPSKPDEEF